MQHFAIGDGNKRITCPDRYFADFEGNDTMVIWDSDHADMPIRISVITIKPKDELRRDLGYARVIENAAKRGMKAEVLGDKSMHRYREVSADDAAVYKDFHDVGLGNHFCLFTLTVPLTKDNSAEHKQIQADLDEMIASLVERGADQQFSCALLVTDLDRIHAATQSLLTGTTDATWTNMQAHLEEAYCNADESAARQVGLAFGECLRATDSSFRWSIKIDEYGSSLALDLGDSQICVFPEDMILQRFDRREAIRLKDLADWTIETLEEQLRNNSTGR